MLIMEEEGAEQRLVKTAAAANVLGISTRTLYRLAPIYEQVHGELPRDGSHGRLWPLEAIERIQSARLTVKDRRAESIEAALRGFDTPEDVQSFRLPASFSGRTLETGASTRALEELVGELHALREAVEAQNRLLTMLLRVEGHHLKRLEAGSPLPVATADTSDGEDDARQTKKARRVFMWILATLLPIPPLVITVMSALTMDALLLMPSLVVLALCLLVSGYYFYYTKADKL
jgi:hypothetical protein